MPPRPGLRFALALGALAILAVGAAGILAKDRIREEWYIWRLNSPDEETRLNAAEALAEMKSIHAVPKLLRLIGEDKREGVVRFNYFRTGPNDPQAGEGIVLTPLAHAIYRIGKGALPILSEAREGYRGILAAITESINSPSIVIERGSYDVRILHRAGEAWPQYQPNLPIRP